MEVKSLSYWSHLLRQMHRFSPDDQYERCGFIVAYWQTQQLSFREVNNGHARPARNAMITTAAIAEQRNRPGAIVGVLHTHPGRYPEDAEPSSNDCLSAAKQPLLLHAFYHPWTRLLTVYDILGPRYRLRAKPKMFVCLR